MNQLIQRLKDKRWRLEHLYYIIDKHGNRVKFKLNGEQIKLFELCEAKKKISKIRLRILKARQMGVTTFFCLYYLDEVIFNRNKTACIIAHEREALEKIFRKVKYAWENMHPAIKPKASMENVRELIFSDRNSSIFIALKIRSGTVQYLHVSEGAYIDNPQELKSGSYQAAGEGHITIETTANGLNDFYMDWINPGLLWENIFLSWYNHREYSTKEKYLSIFDDQLRKEGRTQEQINWYAMKFEEIGKDRILMLREYPSTAEQAFETSNLGVFSEELLGIKEQEPLEIGDTFTKYANPDKDSQYAIGVDSSGGYADGDYGSFYVIDKRTLKTVYRHKSHFAPDLLGKEAVKIAREYNNAMIGFEVNNHGLTAINAVKDDYTELYMRERRDTITDEITKEIGWNTNTKTKIELIDNGKKILRDKSVEELPKELIAEMRTFVRNKENGSVGAESGCHDDEVMAWLIAQMMALVDPYWELKEKPSYYMGRKVNY